MSAGRVAAGFSATVGTGCWRISFFAGLNTPSTVPLSVARTTAEAWPRITLHLESTPKVTPSSVAVSREPGKNYNGDAITRVRATQLK